MAIFQLRNELVVNHFKQLQRHLWQEETNSVFEVKTHKIVICDPADKNISQNYQAIWKSWNSLFFDCELVKNAVTNLYQHGII